MKIYVGHRHDDGCTVHVVDRQADTSTTARPLRLRLDLYNHSPTGFEWGYGGSGPAQLALALLADVLEDDDEAVALHQDFKRRVVGRMPRPGFTLTSEEIKRVAAELRLGQ